MILYGTYVLQHRMNAKAKPESAIVTIGCLNSKVLVQLYLAAISPSAGTVVRVGYFGTFAGL
jgi:hypothetical protein